MNNPENSMKQLRVLGCGDAFSSGGRFNTSFLLSGANDDVLLDCGATTALKLSQENYPIDRINKIFITHFHGDHYGGLPFLILAFAYKIPRQVPLTIFGPPGIERMTRVLQDALYPDTSSLLDELPILFVSYTQQWQTSDDLEFQAIEVAHSPPSIPHGIRLKWEGKMLAFSGDTEWTDNLVELSAGTDIMIIECNNLKEESPGHLSYQCIKENYDRFKTKKMYLSHMGPEMLASDQIAIERLTDDQIIPLW